MTDETASRYDAMPYESRFVAASHPDRMATMAVLHGLQPPRVESCRVLELGCADGGNLFPLAQSMPGATFLGIDVSTRQIAAGQTATTEMGLANVELRVMDLAEIDESLGTFDYIIAHGVYSWVSPTARERLYAVCRERLTSNGVAYVSYNTYPGWHLRGMIREMMLFHARMFPDPDSQVIEARRLLNFLATAALPAESPYAQVLRAEAELLERSRDAYVFHDHLETENHPLYFHEFVDQTKRAGLRYLGPARFNILETTLPQETRDVLARLSTDRVRYEQYLDFILNRTFRQSLLCHPGATDLEGPTVQAVSSLRMTAMARSTTGKLDLQSETPEPFVSIHGDQLAVGRPILKAALLDLFERYPESAEFEELWTRALQRLQRSQPHAAEDRESFASYLLQGHVMNLVDLHTYNPPIDQGPGERPHAGALIRRQAQLGTRVVGLRARFASIQDLDRLILPLCDGTRDREALVDALTIAMNEGQFQMQRDGAELTDPAEIRAILATTTNDALHRLAGEGLFLAD